MMEVGLSRVGDGTTVEAACMDRAIMLGLDPRKMDGRIGRVWIAEGIDACPHMLLATASDGSAGLNVGLGCFEGNFMS